MSTEIYIPKNSITLDQQTIAQIRLGIQGAPGEGKTFAAMTFPNPVVVNFDRGLGAHIGRKDIIEIPFHNPGFVDSITKRNKPTDPPNKRDAFIKWLETEGFKLTNNQTLVVDASTGLEAAFESQQNLEPVVTRDGFHDTYAFWRAKIDYFNQVTDIFFSLNCNVIYTAHEQEERTKKGDYTGKIKPMMTGQFADKLVSKFTDWVRAVAVTKKDPDKLSDKDLKDFGFKTKNEYKEMCDKFPRNTAYLWKLDSDDIFSGKVSSLVNFPTYIPAGYESFCKYLRK